MTEDEMIERGKAVFEDCYRGVVPMPAHITPDNMAGLTMKMFNDHWGAFEDRLSMREKRLIILGGLFRAGGDNMVTIHAECALRNGEMNADTLRAAALMALPYVGFPALSSCYLAIEKVIAKCRADGVDVDRKIGDAAETIGQGA